MKNTIGLLFIGLIIRNGLADVSHLAQSGHNHYLPPPIQDLPVDQDYNGIDSQPQNGVHGNENHGYLPPYQDGQGNGQYDDYDHNIEVSYHNDFAVQPQGQVDDQAHGGHEDDDNEDHVDIDHQQLEPIFPSNFPIQGYYAPNGEPQVNPHNGQRQVKPGRGEAHSISLVRYHHGPVPLSSPAPFTLAQTSPSPLPHGGYDYPRPTKSADFLYPNENPEANSDLSEPDSESDDGVHEHGEADPQRGYLPPPPAQSGQSQGHNNQGPEQGYLPPVQSSHAAQSEPQQDYLSPVHSNLAHQEQQRGYLPPVQSNHAAQSEPQQDYLSPVQANLAQQDQQRGYLPPVQSNHGSHHHAGHGQQGPQQDYLTPNQGPQQDYLAPVQSHTHDHSNSGRVNQGYLPPTQENQATPGSRSHSHHHHHHHHQPQGNQVLNTNTGNSLERDYLPPVQSNHVHHSGHVHSTQSNLGVSPSSLHGQNYLAPTSSPNALQLVPPPQLDVHSDHPAGHVEEKGHINVPLPIPQVGYFFIPGIVTKLPSLAETKNHDLRPVLNLPGIMSTERPKLRPTQRLSSPEYTRAFLFQKKNRPAEQKTSNIVITPSVQTLKQKYQSINQLRGHHHHESQETQENLVEDFASPKMNLQTFVNYLQNTDNRQYLPPHDQSQDHPGQQQSNMGLHTQTSGGQALSPNNYQGMGYLPPVHDHQHHQDNHHHQEEDQHHHHHNHHSNAPPKQRQTYHQESIVRGYLPPDNQNQVTSLKTYMKGVHPNDRYGSSHYQQPPQNEKGNPPPPIGTSPPMYSNPSAIKAYAPGMAYRVTNNAPFSTFTPAAYLPPVESAPPSEDDQDNNVPIGLQLNEEAKRNLARIMPKDNTIFPLDALLDSPDNEIDMPELMEQLRGRIRTVQIVDNHANTAKTFRILETADHKGVKTINILNHNGEDPMGDHKVIRIISQGPHPGGYHQTVKIFSDHKEVTLPTTNAYLPPPKAKETFVRVLRNSQNELRTH